MPATTAVLRVALTVTGAALIAVGAGSGQLAPALGGLAIAVLAATELASWQRRVRERRESDLKIRYLTGLLEATRRELEQADRAAATARADLADLSTEWNSLVQEAMQMGADVFNRREPVRRTDSAPTCPNL